MAEVERKLPLLGMIASAMAMLALNCGALSAEPLKIRIGWANTPATISPLLFQKTDIMRHYGKTYTVEAIDDRGPQGQGAGIERLRGRRRLRVARRAAAPRPAG
jgi:hypothetical protein